jgi:hypothetical protein
MRHVTISLPDALYAELQEAASLTRGHGYGPEHWACDLLAGELASRRIARLPRRARELEGHRVLWP